MSKVLIKLVVLSLALVGLAAADSATIYTSQSDWSSHVGAVTNRDFNSLSSNGAFLGSGFSDNGVTFYSSNNYLFTWGPGTGQNLGTGTYLLAGSWPSTFSAVLSSPSSGFGVDVALDDDTLNQYSSNYYPHTLNVTLNFQSGPSQTVTVAMPGAAGGPFAQGFDFFGATTDGSNLITSVTFAVPNLYPQYYCDPNYCYNGLSGPNLFVDNVQTASATPEPASLVLLGSGLLGIGGTLRKKFMA